MSQIEQISVLRHTYTVTVDDDDRYRSQTLNYIIEH
jgi:hypothetical protein